MSAPDTSAARNEASDWLLRRDSGLSPTDEQELARWIAASPANARAWTEATAAWDSFDGEQDELFQVMRSQALTARPAANDNRKHLAVAASMVGAVLVLGGLGWAVFGPAMSTKPGVPAMQAYATSIGERTEFVLSDGTRVTLDSGSRLLAQVDVKGRRLQLLQGLAYFDVASDRKRPLSVVAGDRTITDLGTKFSVSRERSGSGAVTVVVEEGLVSVTGQGDDVRLRPGDRFQGTIGRAGVVDQIDPAAALAWREGYLEFQDVPLSEAIAAFNNYGGLQITMADAKLRSLRVSGRYKSSDPGSFAQALAATQPITAETSGAGITLRATR